jgi:hypothetical protein
MTEAQLRDKVISAYPKSQSWKTKVLKMKYNQVFALYRKFIQEDKIKP